MNRRIKLAFVAMGFAILIPLGISVFLIDKSYKLEKRKFDFEVIKYSAEVFYSFRADYSLLDSIAKKIVFNKAIESNSLSFDELEKQLKKGYRNYQFIADTLKQKLLDNEYDIEFEYLLEMAEFRITDGNKQYLLIDSLRGKYKPVGLFGGLSNKQKATSYSFFFKGSGYNSLLLLHLDYPDTRSFLLKKVWPLIVGIILSMLVLMLVLAYAVWVMFWQKRVSDMKSHFIDNITHEFNTPVSTLKLTAATIKQINREYNSEDLEKVGVRIHNQASRLSGLIEKVMNLSLNKDRNVKYDFKVVNLNTFVTEIVEKFKADTSEESLNIKMKLSAGHDNVPIDEYYFKVALLNILDNAQKYSKEKAEITVISENLNNSFWLVIKDRGIGIQKKHQKHLFKRFYRANSLKLYKVQGLGFGLSIVKQIIETHKGKVKIESSLEKGTSVSIILSLANEHA